MADQVKNIICYRIKRPICTHHKGHRFAKPRELNLTLDHAIRPRGLRGSWLCNCKMRQQFSHYQRPFFGKAIDRVFKDTSELRNMEKPLEESICRRYRKMLDEFSSIVEATNEVMRDKRRVHQLPMC